RAEPPGFDAADVAGFDGIRLPEDRLIGFAEFVMESIADHDLAGAGGGHEPGCDVESVPHGAHVGAAEWPQRDDFQVTQRHADMHAGSVLYPIDLPLPAVRNGVADVQKGLSGVQGAVDEIGLVLGNPEQPGDFVPYELVQHPAVVEDLVTCL